MLRADNLQIPGLKPLSFIVGDGKCLAIEGPSGSGKTRLLRAIADLEPSSGQVFCNGEERSETSAYLWRRIVRYVSAEPGWWTATARQAVDDEERAQRFARLSENLALGPELLDRPLDVVSTGERQRLALALALSDEPPVLLLDEPTGALDTTATALVEEQLRYLLHAGRSIVLVSHDPAQRKRLAHDTLSLPLSASAVAARTRALANGSDRR